MDADAHVSFRHELLRKGIHLSSLSIPVIYYFISRDLALALLIPVTALFLIGDLLRCFHRPSFELYQKIFGPMLRQHEKMPDRLTLNGATWVLISATICVLAFPKLITITAFSILIISDTTDPIGMAERLFSEEFYQLMRGALTPGGAIATQCEQMFFDTGLIKEIYAFVQKLAKNPTYYHALIPTYPGGGIGFMYTSNVPWTNGLTRAYPPGQMNYLNPDIHRAAFALPEFFRRELYE